MLAGTLVRAATPAIARAIAQKGAKKIAESGIKNAIKKYGTPKNITSLSRVKNMKGSGASAAAKEVMKKFPVPKNKSLTIPKAKSNVGAKIVAGGATAVTGAAALGSKDKDKGKAKASTVKKPFGDDKNRFGRGAKPNVSQGSTTSTMTFGKAFRAAKDAGKKEFMFRGKKYNTRTKDEEKAMAKNQPLPKSRPSNNAGMGKVDSLSKGRKSDNMEGGTAPVNKKEQEGLNKPKYEKKERKGFLERMKEDFNKAVKETKRNFQGDAEKGTGRYKSVSKGTSNIKNSSTYKDKKKMMGGGYSTKTKKKAS